MMLKHFRQRLTRALAFVAAIVLSLGSGAAVGQCACDVCACSATADSARCCCSNNAAKPCCGQQFAKAAPSACCEVALAPGPAGCTCQAAVPQPQTTLLQHSQANSDSSPVAIQVGVLVEDAASKVVRSYVPAALLTAAIPKHLLFCVWRN
jgi:hypothetical protein